VFVDSAQWIISLANFSVAIAPSCSGFEGMGLMAALMIAYLYEFRETYSFPRAWVAVPLAVAAAWVGNGLRIAVLLLIGAYVDPTLARGAFHSKAGWVFFCAMALAAQVVIRKSSFVRRAGSREESGLDSENPTAAYLVPMLALIAVGLVTGLFARELDLLYGARILVVAPLLWRYRRVYRALVDQRRWIPFTIAVGFAVAAFWIVTAPNPEADSTSRRLLSSLPPLQQWSWLLLRMLGTSLVVPCCEELAFRGYLLRRLVHSNFEAASWRVWTPLSLLVSSLAFGLGHARWVAASLAGACFAAVQIRRGSWFDALVAHVVTNTTIAAWVLATGEWSLLK